MINKSRGVTLIEVMLVLAIAVVIILMGINQYRMYRVDSYYMLVKYNVDILLEGLKQYYQTNCKVSGNKLWPTSGTYSAVSLDYATMAPYLTGEWPYYTPVVSSQSGSIVSSFYPQFNPMPLKQKTEYPCFLYNAKLTCASPKSIPNTKVILWQAQVVVKMANPTQAVHYIAILGASCGTNSFTSGNTVNCANNKNLTQAEYLVWQGLPSSPSGSIGSAHWMANPVSKLFNLQYTNDPMYEMYNSKAVPDSNNQVYYMNYLCGS